MVMATSKRQLFILEANTVTERHELNRSITCMLPLPDNLLAVSMAKVGGSVRAMPSFYT
jgi:hypothetical protein